MKVVEGIDFIAVQFLTGSTSRHLNVHLLPSATLIILIYYWRSSKKQKVPIYGLFRIPKGRKGWILLVYLYNAYAGGCRCSTFSAILVNIGKKCLADYKQGCIKLLKNSFAAPSPVSATAQTVLCKCPIQSIKTFTIGKVKVENESPKHFKWR